MSESVRNNAALPEDWSYRREAALSLAVEYAKSRDHYDHSLVLKTAEKFLEWLTMPAPVEQPHTDLSRPQIPRPRPASGEFGDESSVH
jgi:hypothetical protein